MQIIDYINKDSVLIKFLSNTEYQVWTTMTNIRNGEIKNPFKKSVYGIGYYGCGTNTARKNTKKTNEYTKWFSMFVRCYDDKYHERQPQYIGCKVAEEFHNFQNFSEWYKRKIYDCKYPLELDKDLLIGGNRIYSPSACCFIPKEINTVINSQKHNRVRMTELYLKYKNDVPFYIRNKLFSMTTI